MLYTLEREQVKKMYNGMDLDKIDINSEPPTEEPFRQYYFMAKCRRWVKDFEQKNGLMADPPKPVWSIWDARSCE